MWCTRCVRCFSLASKPFCSSLLQVLKLYRLLVEYRKSYIDSKVFRQVHRVSLFDIAVSACTSSTLEKVAFHCLLIGQKGTHACPDRVHPGCTMPCISVGAVREDTQCSAINPRSPDRKKRSRGSDVIAVLQDHVYRGQRPVVEDLEVSEVVR